MLGGQAMLAAGIVHSFVKDAASKRLDKKLVKAAAGYRPDVHLAPPTSWVGAPPTLEELANPHAYSRSWDPLKERLLLAFRTGPVPLARGVDGSSASHCPPKNTPWVAQQQARASAGLPQPGGTHRDQLDRIEHHRQGAATQTTLLVRS